MPQGISHATQHWQRKPQTYAAAVAAAAVAVTARVLAGRGQSVVTCSCSSFSATYLRDLVSVVVIETSAETISSLSAMTAAGKLRPDVSATFDDDLQPPTWNESSLPYLGDLTPKPTWEIIVRVSHWHRHHRCHIVECKRSCH